MRNTLRLGSGGEWQGLPRFGTKYLQRHSVGLTELVKLVSMIFIAIIIAPLLIEPKGVLKGISIAGMPVDGMKLDKRALIELAKHRAKTFQGMYVHLLTPQGQISISVNSLGASFAPESAAGVVWLFGREPSLLQRLKSRICALRGVNVPIPTIISESSVNRLCKDLFKKPRNATVQPLNSNLVRVVPEAPGYRVNPSTAKIALERAISLGQFTVCLRVEPIRPSVSTTDLIGVTRVRAHVQVPFTSRSASALHNAELAIQILDGAYVRAGDEFSFNKWVGERTLERGFLPGPTLFRGRQTRSIGGGICPVATALGIAILKAGLRVTERHQHSRIVQYAKPGLDFTVDYSRRDVRFVNTTNCPIVVRTALRGRVIHVWVCGAPMHARISLTTKSTRKGRWLSVTTHRTWRFPNGRIFTEMLFTSRYRIK